MPQIVTIGEKAARVGIQELDDIIGVFEDTHVFSPDELANFNIYQVDWYTVKELQLALYQRRVKTAIMWQDTDDTWKELKESPKYKQSLKTLTEVEKTAIVDSKSTLAEKNTILDSICDRTKDLSVNQSIVNATLKVVE